MLGRAVAATQGDVVIMWHQMIVTLLNASATYGYFPRIRTVLATAWQGNIRGWRGRCVVLGTS